MERKTAKKTLAATLLTLLIISVAGCYPYIDNDRDDYYGRYGRYDRDDRHRDDDRRRDRDYRYRGRYRDRDWRDRG